MKTQLTKEQINRLPVDKRNITLADGTLVRQGKPEKSLSALAEYWATEAEASNRIETDEMIFASR